jgi:hypothetical protein
MKYKYTTKRGVLHYELSDGREGTIYPNGYVRVSTHYCKQTLYQINKKELVWSELTPVDRLSNADYKYFMRYRTWKRILIPNFAEQLLLLWNFNAKNCR